MAVKPKASSQMLGMATQACVAMAAASALDPRKPSQRRPGTGSARNPSTSGPSPASDSHESSRWSRRQASTRI